MKTSVDDIIIAALDEKDLEVIRQLEKKLGDDICLVAVHKRDVMYALEAKMAANDWQRVDSVYPGIEGLKAFYHQYDDVKQSKTALKELLIAKKGQPGYRKRPIRIRQIISSTS
jgi:hypothetical protein